MSLIQGSINSPDIDAIIYVTASKTGPDPLDKAINDASELDKAFHSNVSILSLPLPAKRLIYSPISKHSDYDDVRSYSEAAVKGVKRALSSGVTKPLLLVEGNGLYPRADFATVLGALEALYTVKQFFG